MKKFWIILGVIICVLSLAGPVVAVVYQVVLSIQEYGMIFRNGIVIWDKSLLWFLTIVAFPLGEKIINLSE